MKAFVLVKGRDAERIREYVRGMKGVEKAYIVYGGYDLVIEVEFPSVEELGSFVMKEIRNRFRVDDTMTLIVAD